MLQLPITKHVQKPQPAGAAITLQHASYTPLSGAPQQSLQFGLPAKFAFYLWLTFSVRCRRRMWQWGEAGACRVDFQFSSCFKKWRSHFFRLFFFIYFLFLIFFAALTSLGAELQTLELPRWQFIWGAAPWNCGTGESLMSFLANWVAGRTAGGKAGQGRGDFRSARKKALPSHASNYETALKINLNFKAIYCIVSGLVLYRRDWRGGFTVCLCVSVCVCVWVRP